MKINKRKREFTNIIILKKFKNKNLKMLRKIMAPIFSFYLKDCHFQ